MDDVKTLVEAIVTDLRPLEIEANRAWWQAAVTGEASAYRHVERVRNRIDRLLADPKRFDRLAAARENGVGDPLLARRIELLYLESLPRQVDPELGQAINRLATESERTFATFRPLFRGQPATVNDLDRVLKTERDEGIRRDAYEALKTVGPRVASHLGELVGLRNEAARQVGFPDFYRMRLAAQEQDSEELFGLLSRLDYLSREAFAQSKGAIDEALARRFGRSPEELEPWHYADQFFQEVPDVFGANLDAVYAEVDPPAVAEGFFSGIGLPVADVLARSSLWEADGKDPHAFATDIDREGDVRILLNLRRNERWMGTTLHELGHAVYDLGIDRELPWDLRRPSHILFTEAIAMLFGRLSRDAAWMRDMGIVDTSTAARLAESTSAEIDATMRIVTRWVLVMAHFERGLYAAPDQDLNALWWNLVERFQGISRPERPAGAADYAAKIHMVLAPVYYHNYLLGECFASQIDRRLREEVLQDGSSYAGHEGVGRWLSERVFRPGARVHYDMLALESTGSAVGPEAFAARFLAE